MAQDIILNCATINPICLVASPGVGKTAIVRGFTNSVGLDLVELTGTQMAPEDVSGCPDIKGDYTVFKPQKRIARDRPYCLFLDEINIASVEVQKSFYSLLTDKRVESYTLPEGSIVIAAGNFSTDKAITKKMSSALINRVRFVTIKVDAGEWLKWAHTQELHPWVTEYIKQRPGQLFEKPPTEERPFSTPRSWHNLSKDLKCYNQEVLTNRIVQVTAEGWLNPEHAKQFSTFVKNYERRYEIHKIIKGDAKWPFNDHDTMYFLGNSMRDILYKNLPPEKPKPGSKNFELVFNAKARLKELALFQLEYAQMIVQEQEDGSTLQPWFLTEIARDIPRLSVERKVGKKKDK